MSYNGKIDVKFKIGAEVCCWFFLTKYRDLFFLLIFRSRQAFEDINLDKRPVMKNVLNVMNYIFAVTFTVEMLLKIFGMGFVGYFTNLWNCLDFFIVAVCFFFLLEIRIAQMSSFLYSTWR